MSSASAQNVVIEGQFHNFETSLQYENHRPLPFLVERDMLGETVGDIKRAILKLTLMSFVTESPENLQMYIVQPPDSDLEEHRLLLMDETKQLREYLAELSCSKTLKLQRIMPMGVNQHI